MSCFGTKVSNVSFRVFACVFRTRLRRFLSMRCGFSKEQTAEDEERTGCGSVGAGWWAGWTLHVSEVSFWLFIFDVRAHRAVFCLRHTVPVFCSWAHRVLFLPPCVVFWEHRANFLSFSDTSCPNSFAFLTLTGTQCCFLLLRTVTTFFASGHTVS